MSRYTGPIRDAFFSRATVVGSVKACVKSLSHYTEDPLVSFANVAIQKPLSFTVTTQGLCPFEENVRIIIPYAAMSAGQLAVMRELMDLGSERQEFMNCSHQNGDFSVTGAYDRRAVHVDPCLVIFGIFSLVRSAAAVRSLDARTILSVMQQHIISTLCLHQHQLQGAWRLMRETAEEGDGGGGQTKSSAGTTPE
jgi:hypothetical protein